MSVKILWHRQWAGFAISGLCERNKTQYWFEWNFQTNNYNGYHLQNDDFEKLEEELTNLRESYGDVIFHDERYKPILSSEIGLSQVKVANINTNPENIAFEFTKESVINPIPHQIYYSYFTNSQ